MKAHKIEIDTALSRTGADKEIENRGLMAKMRYDVENRLSDIEAQLTKNFKEN